MFRVAKLFENEKSEGFNKIDENTTGTEFGMRLLKAEEIGGKIKFVFGDRNRCLDFIPIHCKYK